MPFSKAAEKNSWPLLSYCENHIIEKAFYFSFLDKFKCYCRFYEKNIPDPDLLFILCLYCFWAGEGEI